MATNILPPEDDKNSNPARPSVRVIVIVDGFDQLWFARYMWELGYWHVEGIVGTHGPKVRRWWSPKELNKGYKYHAK